MKIINKFNVGNEVFYINNGQLYKGVIESVSITQRVDSERITYTFNGNYFPYEECHVFSTVDDAIASFLSNVKENK